MLSDAFFKNGWCRFPFDPVLAHWVVRSLAAARHGVVAAENAHWLRCGGTWFAGVNALANDAAAAVADGIPLAGVAVDFIGETLGLSAIAWDAGQVSVCYPGYPQPMPSESEAAFGYRRNRDAAHLDGLRAEGPARRRYLLEHHGFILGIPLVVASPEASPLVVWEGSHEMIREAFKALYAGKPPQAWGGVDATEVYRGARRRIFEHCRRVEVAATPGEAYLIHRLALHGVAPWGPSAQAGPDGRMIVYFRPETGGPEAWLNAP